MAWLTSGRFRARILTGLASLCLLAGLAAFSALALAAPEDPVNGIEQAYKGLPFGPDPVPEVQQTYIDYYFMGNANDQTSKAGGISASSATFDQTAPAGPNTIAQQSSWTASATTAGDPRAAYWKGPFTGTFEGDVELRWSWSSPNPVAEFGSDVEVTIFADPSTTQGGGTILGRGIVTPAIKSSPVRSVQKVFAKGTVNSTLLIQVRSRYSDAGNGHQVHYGSQAHPSGFAIPQGPYLPPPKPQTSSTPYSGQMHA